MTDMPESAEGQGDKPVPMVRVAVCLAGQFVAISMQDDSGVQADIALSADDAKALAYALIDTATLARMHCSTILQ